jgi:hypothetical protein
MSKLGESKYGITEATMIWLENGSGKFCGFVILECSWAQYEFLRAFKRVERHTAIEALAVSETIGGSGTYRVVPYLGGQKWSKKIEKS